jgi:hypothetical protein
MFIVIEIQTDADNNVGNFVWAFPTLDQAQAKYYAVLSAAASSSLVVHSALIINKYGDVIETKCFNREG